MVVLIAGAAIALVVNFARDKPKDETVDTPSRVQRPATPAVKAPLGDATVEVTAGNLYKDYVTNEIGADAKYRDKVLRVSGIIGSIGKDALDKPYVELQAAGGSKSIRALFASESGLGDLKRPEAIAIRCRGGNELGLPTLSECIFEKRLDE